MLCLLSRQQDIESAWACLVWIESQRYKLSTLSQSSSERWKKALFSGQSLERLLNASQPFDATVLNLVTDSVFAPMFNARGVGPDAEALAATMESWDPKEDHLILSLTSFLESLPGPSVRLLLDLPGSDFLRVAWQRDRLVAEHQRTALLFQVLLHLYYSDALSEAMLADLYRFDNTHPTQEWERLLEGLQRFPLALQSRRRDG